MTVPRSTYRLQMRPEFGFADAAAIAPYLAELGVSHAYFSPYLQAAPGSTHGYDVVDPGRVNDELGGEAAYRSMCAALGAAGLGQVLDVVPNHMAISAENGWWWDVLENGPSSRHALYFDVAWEPPEAKLRNTILVPVLGDHYGRILEAGELRLERHQGSFRIRYFDHVFPVAPASLGELLGAAARRAGSDELAELADSFSGLRQLDPKDYDSALARHAQKEQLRTRLEELCAQDGSVAGTIDEMVTVHNDDPDRLDSLLEDQNYRLARWQTAGYELDYRRFFDINSLAALRMEDERVFTATHSLILGWLKDGTLDGIRIDHPDGLRDPEAYFRRLAQAVPEAWIVAEKILEPGERLPESWPVAGTTGYDFAHRALGLLVDPAGEVAMSSLYRAFTGHDGDPAALIYESKQMVMRQLLASDLNRLVALFVRVCEEMRRYRDFTRQELLLVLRETIACLRVYRTYVTRVEVSAQDRSLIDEACGEAARRRPDLDPELLTLMRSLLLMEAGPGEAKDELVARFQQTSGPVMAKGVEDTVFYLYNRLTCLNEVGGDPAQFGVLTEEFHAAAAEQAERWPAAMLTTSTHDTKRSEDVRARIALLAEIPGDWERVVRAWSRLAERYRTGGMPDRNDEYLLYQTLVGAWPLAAGRAGAYMEKATKEAKANTSWIAPVPEYDAAVRGFVDGVIGDPDLQFSLEHFVRPLLEPGWTNSLALKLIALTSPGVPDLYQGTELWDLSLVDPDNRRPVDYEVRRRLLAELDRLTLEEVWARRAEGLPKLLVVQRALRLRARRPQLFQPGAAYRPLAAEGEKAAHLVGFCRGEGAVTLVPRLPIGLGGDWADTSIELPAGAWLDELTGLRWEGGRQQLTAVLGSFPVALLSRDSDLG